MCVCAHLHVCIPPIKLLASARTIVCEIGMRVCLHACTQAVEMVAVKGGLLGKR